MIFRQRVLMDSRASITFARCANYAYPKFRWPDSSHPDLPTDRWHAGRGRHTRLTSFAGIQSADVPLHASPGRQCLTARIRHHTPPRGIPPHAHTLRWVFPAASADFAMQAARPASCCRILQSQENRFNSRFTDLPQQVCSRFSNGYMPCGSTPRGDKAWISLHRSVPVQPGQRVESGWAAHDPLVH